MQDPGDMDEEPQTQAQRASNLARIRENQRRSRARRKEYLQELETKYRSCEQVGIEASAEIQAAARRVVDENKRLRLILHQRGLSDAEIDSIVGDADAASTLEGLLGQRRACGPSPGGGCSVSSTDGKSSIAPAVTAPSGRSTTSPTVTQSLQATANLHAVTSELQYLSPTQPTMGNTTTHLSPTSHMQSSYQSTSLPMMDYGMGGYSNDPFAWQQHQQYHIPHQPQSHDPETSSCYAAASVIRTIKPELGLELETELGCGDGRECNVPNARIFNIMDRYTSDGPTI